MWRASSKRASRSRRADRRIVLRDVESDAHLSDLAGFGSGFARLQSRLGRTRPGLRGDRARGARAAPISIVISKFSKQEAERGGLADAFRAAMASRVPVMCAVSPDFLDEWRAFAGPLAEDVAPDARRCATGGTRRGVDAALTSPAAHTSGRPWSTGHSAAAPWLAASPGRDCARRPRRNCRHV